MKRIALLSLYFLAAAIECRAVNVTFGYEDTLQRPQAMHGFVLYRLTMSETPAAPWIATRDRVKGNLGADGTTTVSNLLGGSYRAEFSGDKETTTNWFLFPVTNGTVYAHDCPASGPVGGSGSFSVVAGENLTAVTDNGVMTISAPAMLINGAMNVSLNGNSPTTFYDDGDIGTTNASFDYKNREFYDNQGYRAINYQLRWLLDDSGDTGTLMLDWENARLYRYSPKPWVDQYGNALLFATVPANGGALTNLIATNIINPVWAGITNYTAAVTNAILSCAGTNQVITLPVAAATGFILHISSVTATSSVIVTNGNGSQTIGGSLWQNIPATNCATVWFDGAKWNF